MRKFSLGSQLGSSNVNHRHTALPKFRFWVFVQDSHARSSISFLPQYHPRRLRNKSSSAFSQACNLFWIILIAATTRGWGAVGQFSRTECLVSSARVFGECIFIASGI